MGKPLLLDTDVMVDFLRGCPEAVALISARVDEIALSSIVVAELYAGVRGDEELAKMDRLLSLFRLVPVSAELARAGGQYKKSHGASHGVGLADAIIAATAAAEGAELKTLNTKHYPMIEALAPAYSK